MIQKHTSSMATTRAKTTKWWIGGRRQLQYYFIWKKLRQDVVPLQIAVEPSIQHNNTQGHTTGDLRRTFEEC